MSTEKAEETATDVVATAKEPTEQNEAGSEGVTQEPKTPKSTAKSKYWEFVDEDGGDAKKGLLEQPVEQLGRRERRTVDRISTGTPKTPDAGRSAKLLERNGHGRGTALGDIPFISASLDKHATADLRALHQALFGSVGTQHQVKRNIRKFNGWEFAADSDEAKRRQAYLERQTKTALRELRILLGLHSDGTDKEDEVRLLFDFFCDPEDKGRKVPKSAKKKKTTPKKSSAAAATKSKKSQKTPTKKAAKDEEESDSEEDDDDDDDDDEDDVEEEEEEKETPKKTRGRPKTKKAKSDSDSDEDNEEDDDAVEEKAKEKEVVKKSPARTRGRPKKTVVAKEDDDETKPSKKSITKAVPKKRVAAAAEEKGTDRKRARLVDSDTESGGTEDHQNAQSSKPLDPTDEQLVEAVDEELGKADLKTVSMRQLIAILNQRFPGLESQARTDFLKSTIRTALSKPTEEVEKPKKEEAKDEEMAPEEVKKDEEMDERVTKKDTEEPNGDEMPAKKEDEQAAEKSNDDEMPVEREKKDDDEEKMEAAEGTSEEVLLEKKDSEAAGVVEKKLEEGDNRTNE